MFVIKDQFGFDFQICNSISFFMFFFLFFFHVSNFKLISSSCFFCRTGLAINWDCQKDIMMISNKDRKKLTLYPYIPQSYLFCLGWILILRSVSNYSPISVPKWLPKVGDWWVMTSKPVVGRVSVDLGQKMTLSYILY